MLIELAPTQIKRRFSETALLELEKIQAQFPSKKSALMMVMRLAEREFGHIDEYDCGYIGKLCEVSASHVLGMLNFYFHFKREFHGEFRVMICGTLMCQLRGAKQVTKHLEEKLGIKCGTRTENGKFSLEKVECLAACEHAPCMQVNDDYYHDLTPETVDLIISALEKNDKAALAKLKGKYDFVPQPRI